MFRFLRRIVISYSQHNCTKHAAAMAYFSLFSIFPLLLSLIYGASFFFPTEASRQTLASYLNDIIPYGAEDLFKIVEQTWDARGTVGIVSGVALLWGGSSIFSALETSLSTVWNTSPRPYLRRRGLAIMAVVVLVVTFLLSFMIGPVANLILENVPIGQQAVTYVLELGVLTAMIMLLYRIFPNEDVYWRAAFLGAFIASVLMVLARLGFRIYTSIVVARNGLLYGSLTWFLTLALWVYLVAVLILFGAEFAAAFQNRRKMLESRTRRVGNQEGKSANKPGGTSRD